MPPERTSDGADARTRKSGRGAAVSDRTLAEEYPRILEYGARHYPFSMPSPDQMTPAIVLADLAPILVATNAWRSPPRSWRMQVGLGYQAALCANALGHIAQTLWFRDYSPGTLTGALLIVPLSMYLYRRALGEGLLTRRQLVEAAAIGTIGMPVGILLLQAAGAALAS
jgi:hypothetical protein